MSPEDPEDAVSLTLPVSGDPLPHGAEPETFVLVIDKKCTKAKMIETLKRYRLPSYGNRAVLISRLQEYAEDKAQWFGQWQGQSRKNARGKSTGSRAQKHLQRRICEAFGEDEIREYPSKRCTTDISSSTTGSSLFKAAMSWAASGPAPTMTAHTAGTTASHHDSIRENGCSELLETQISSAAIRGTFGLHRVEQKIDLVLSHLAPVAVESSVKSNTVFATTAPAQLSNDPNSTASSAEHATDEPMNLVSPELVLAQQASNLQDIGAYHVTRTICLGHNPDDFVTFDEGSVPSRAPTASFPDVNQLFEEWYASSRLQLGNPPRPIPIRAWNQVFQKKKGSTMCAWKSLRSSWSNWKFIIEEYERLGSSRASFWSKYSTHTGEPFGYQRIVTALKAARKLETPTDELEVLNAKRYFGGRLDHPDAGDIFMYKRSNEMITRKTPKHIADRWRALLKTDPTVAIRWAAMQNKDDGPLV